MAKPTRLLSLDAFRGFTIAAMILVNAPGSWNHVYPQLEHAAWNGLTCADLVFPFFLWIVGVAMTFSFAARREAALAELLPGIARRTALLFLLGLVYNTLPFGLLPGQNLHWATLRIPGVLQRIALCYGLGSLIYLRTGPRGRLLAILVCCVGYGVFMYGVPVPGVGAGVLEPGRNFAHHLDALVLRGHAWEATAPWDPEGLLGTLTALATLLLGTLAGDWLARPGPAPKSGRLALAGVGLALLGLGLARLVPVNKTLWSPSYVLVTAGCAQVGFSLCQYLVDVRGQVRWAKPFIIYGSNAILVYLLSCALTRCAELIRVGTATGPMSLGEWVYQRGFCAVASPINASALYALGNVLLLFLPVGYLYRRRWFLKV